MKPHLFASKPKRFVMFAVFGIVFLAVMGWVVMALWNHIVPAIFGFRTITYFQAIWLLMLCRILFGGMRAGHRGGRGGGFGGFGGWARMSPEEREKFRQGLDGYLRTHPGSRYREDIRTAAEWLRDDVRAATDKFKDEARPE